MISCKSCFKEKDRKEFYRNSSKKSGYDSYCKSCRLAYTKLWSKTGVGKLTRYKARRASYLRNKSKELARSREWRRGVKKGTPLWLTKDQRQEIEFIYSLARECTVIAGERYHVDHIVPICGENACGLHVPWNLQVLPADINMSKSNKPSTRRHHQTHHT